MSEEPRPQLLFLLDGHEAFFENVHTLDRYNHVVIINCFHAPLNLFSVQTIINIESTCFILPAQFFLFELMF